MSPDRTESVLVEDVRVDGPHGPLRLRTYTPEQTAMQSGLVWVHGGAVIEGSLDMPEADWVARSLAVAGIPVVSVDYRLAPPIAEFGWDLPPSDEVVFPVASEEVTAAFSLAADTRIAGVTHWSLGGASAGGNLAAGAAMRLRDLGGATPRSLVLAYPLAHRVLPAQTPELAVKTSALPDSARFKPGMVALMNDNYVGHSGAAGSPYAFPGGEDVSSLPPVLIVNSDADDLRSSGQAFASELAAAGVDVAVVRENGTRHGHLNDPAHPGATRTVERFRSWLTTIDLQASAHDIPIEDANSERWGA